ncbi:MAG: zinc ribbon domain-containing protein [Asgard group archaeon]|nr:zinc ribbon domain-containing protein [Asgard group archaeon]
MTTTQVYDKSSTDMVKYSALIFVLAQAVSFGMAFIESDYIGLVGDIIYALGLFLLGTAIHKIGMSFPIARRDADTTKQWLYVFGGSLLVVYIPFVGLLGAIVALVSSIVCFLKLNNLFKKITQSAPQHGQLDSWVFPLYAFYGLIAGVAIFIAALAIVISGLITLVSLFILALVVGIGGILLALGVAYVLYQNSLKLENIRQSIDFSQLASTPAPGVYAPATTPTVYTPAQSPVQTIPPESGEEATKFCSNCGSSIIESDKFCPNCGATVN